MHLVIAENDLLHYIRKDSLLRAGWGLSSSSDILKFSKSWDSLGLNLHMLMQHTVDYILIIINNCKCNKTIIYHCK